LYVNGVLEASGATDPGYAGDPGFQIGSSACCARMGNAFAGLVDEVQVFNSALSQTKIQAIVDAGSFGKCKP
jgi:Concanavalin A-like lectin/glucanases superfamily